MNLSPGALLDRARTPEGQKMVRYTLVSVVSVVVSEIVLFACLQFAHWSARSSNIIATSVATIPSYYLNRTWAWGKSGRSHFRKEVLPFWTLAFIGLAFSTWAADYAESKAPHFTDVHVFRTGIVMFAALAAFGILWIAKFVIFNKVLFKHHPEVLEENPALDGHTGIPT